MLGVALAPERRGQPQRQGRFRTTAHWTPSRGRQGPGRRRAVAGSQTTIEEGIRRGTSREQCSIGTSSAPGQPDRSPHGSGPQRACRRPQWHGEQPRRELRRHEPSFSLYDPKEVRHAARSRTRLSNTALTCEARPNEDGARSAPTNRILRFVRLSALFGRPYPERPSSCSAVRPMSWAIFRRSVGEISRPW